jgi:hypothetical protein
MDIADNILTSQRHLALEFCLLPDEEIQRLRYDFYCPECKQPAFYRKGSRSGRNPCFGAVHLDDCRLAVRSDDPWGDDGDEVVQRLEADNTKIVLGLSDEGGGERSTATSGSTSDRRGGGRSFSGGGQPGRTQIQRNADKLLRLLVAAPTFRTSSLILATPHGETPIHDFFVAIAQADKAKHAGQFHGFWGELTRTNVWSGTRFFNGAGRPSLGFEFGAETVRKVMEKYQLSHIEDLLGRTVLFLGVSRQTQNDSFMMDVSNMSYVAVLPEGFPIAL